MDDFTPMQGDALRPRAWDDYVGQEPVKRLLDVRIRGAVEGKRALDHVLLAGPAGAGKTTLAQMIALRLGDRFYAIDHPVKLNELWAIIKHLEWGVLFIDEIHRFGKPEQENLYTLMHDHYMQMGGRILEVPWLTVIGATTEPERLNKPLRDRFPLRPRFVDYTDEELKTIVAGMASAVDLELSDEEAAILGRATGGIPRRAKDFVLHARDVAAAEGAVPSAVDVLAMLNVDVDGLDADHIAYLETLDRLGGSAGIQKIADHLRLDQGVLRELERALVNQGLISYDRGRSLTPAGYARLGHGVSVSSDVHPRALAS